VLGDDGQKFIPDEHVGLLLPVHDHAQLGQRYLVNGGTISLGAFGFGMCWQIENCSHADAQAVKNLV
jgi:hypothetical protein